MTNVLRSTSTRLALAVTASFLLGFVLLGTGVYYTVSTLLARDARAMIHVNAVNLVDIYNDSGVDGLLTEVNERVAEDADPDAVYAVIAADGRIVGGTFARLPAGLVGKRWTRFTEQSASGRLRVIANLQRLPDGYTLLAGMRTRTQDRFLEQMQRTALVALWLAATLGVVIGWLTSRWVSRRLGSLDDTAARVGAGELGLRAETDGSDDAFDRLARRFNGMLDRIQELLDGVRHATDHIAHDLRTPLTRLRNLLDGLRRRQPAEGEQAVALDAAIAETDQLLQSFGALLRLARIEAQSPVRDQPALDLAALLRDAVELYLPIAAERGIALRTELEPGLINGDADQLFQMVVNLLDNAVKYSPSQSEIVLRLMRQPSAVVLEVADRGAGIPVSDRERVFDRFERLEAHRGAPGVGLGLSLVRAVARRHGGQVTLHDNRPGLRVRVVLAHAQGPRGLT